MENLSVALKHVSHAVDLDSGGFQQAAFSKYLQSLQVLILCINSLYTSSGFQKMLEKKKEVMQVLSMIHECSDRISVILNDCGKPVKSPIHRKHLNDSDLDSSSSQMSVFEKVQRENMKLLKLYKMRLERVNDKATKTNLTLEFQRRLAENAALAKNKYDLIVKQLQKERVQLMESEIRKLFKNVEQLSEKEREKRQLYDKVLNFVKTEEWPSSWKLNSFELTILEVTEKLFYRIIRCCEHPLTQWLLLVQTSIKRKVDSLLNEFHDYICFFPELSCESRLPFSIQESEENITIKDSQSYTILPCEKLNYLEGALETVSSEIRVILEDALEIFYLTYKSLLPEDSEVVCYQTIEHYFLNPFLSKLSTLFRILNLPSEYKICESMQMHKYYSPSDFGITSYIKSNDEFYNNVIALLKTMLLHQSLLNKLRVLVQVSQKICDCDIVGENFERKLGTDEMIPVLCYIIVKSELSQLVSECHMLQHLFDMRKSNTISVRKCNMGNFFYHSIQPQRYMLGEEGFALSSFLLALKCIEIKKLTECKDVEEQT